MNIYSVLEILAGLSFFLYGMNVMSSSLEKMAGNKLEKIMKTVTANKLVSFLFGVLITVVMQSSSGAMVMLIGLVNSGILNFEDTLPLILGTNVGTTVTGWILSLTGISTEGFSIMSIFSPEFFSPLMAFTGILLRMMGKKEKQRYIGTILIGFALLMYGMSFMSGAMKSVSSEPWFAQALIMFKNPFLAFLISIVFTAVIQSSAATIGIIEAIAVSGAISYQAAIPLVLGANVGTCITGVLSSIGTSKNAKRVSILQVLVNATTAVIILLIMTVFTKVPFMAESISVVQIALVHTAFNLLVTVLSFILEKPLINLTKVIIKNDPDEMPQILIDERLINQPSIAVNECLGNTMVMAALAKEELEKALGLFFSYDEETVSKINELEKKVDWYQDQLDSYLVKLSRVSLSKESSEDINKMLHLITDFERIGDHAVNLSKIASSINAASARFSSAAMNELSLLRDAITEILGFATDSFINDDLASAAQVEPLEQSIDRLIDQITDNHVERLTNGTCSIEIGLQLAELLNNCERVSDHCSNIAVCMIELSHDEFYTHQYLHDYKHDSEEFVTLFNYYHNKYQLNDQTEQ